MAGILDRPIYTYKPMQEGQKYIAIIKSFNMVFRGDTAMQAKKIADDFRWEEVLRINRGKLTPEQVERGEAAKARNAARKAARSDA
jgi:hypothetical protein